MFKVEKDNNIVVLEIILPENHTAAELVELADIELKGLISEGRFYGMNVRIFGRLTTGMAMSMGHLLAHVCKSVEMFDPKENRFYKVISH